MTGLFHSAWVQCKSIHGDSGSHSNAVGWPSPFPLQAECPESVHRCQNKVFLFWIQFARTEGCPPTHLTAKDHIEAKWLVFWCCIWQCNVPDFWSCFWFSIWRHPFGIWRDPSGIWRHPSGFLRDPSGCAFCLNQDKSQLQFLFFPQREGVSLCAVWNTMGAIVCCFNEANKLKNRRFLCRTIVLTRTQCAKTHTRTQNTMR